MLMVPKADPTGLDLVAGFLGHGSRAIALIETVEAQANLRIICKNPIVSQLAFGNLDFGVDAGDIGAKQPFVGIDKVSLPPYAPELNPMESIWDYLRGNKLSRRVWDSYEAIVAACKDA